MDTGMIEEALEAAEVGANNAEVALKRLEEILAAAEAELLRLDGALEPARFAATEAAGDAEAEMKTVVGKLVDGVFEMADAPLTALEDAIGRGVAALGVVSSLEEQIFEVHNATQNGIADITQTIIDRSLALQADFDAGFASIEAVVETWTETSGHTAERVTEHIKATVALLDGSTDALDLDLDKLIGSDVTKRIDIFADAIEGHLTFVETFIEQMGGQIVERFETIGEAVGAVADVVEAIEPVAQAFEAVS